MSISNIFSQSQLVETSLSRDAAHEIVHTWQPSDKRINSKISQLSTAARAMLIDSASRAGKWQLLEFLLVNGEISTDTRMNALYAACFHRCNTTCEHNDATCHRNLEKTQQPISCAAKIASLLLLNGTISMDVRSKMVRHATEQCQFEIIEVLLANGEVDINTRCGAVFKAIETHNLEVADRLSTSGEISSWTKVMLASNLIYEDKVESVKRLLAEIHPASVFDRSHLLSCAAMHGNEEIVTLLLDSGEITASAQEYAISEALDRRHYNIAEIIRNNSVVQMDQVDDQTRQVVDTTYENVK